MDLTRRTLLRRAAAASGALAAGSLAGPRMVFAGTEGEAVFEMRLPRGPGRRGAAAGRAATASPAHRWRSGVIRAKRPFELIGFELGRRAVALDVRARGLDGRWSEWLPVQRGHDEATLSDPVWTGPAQAFELRAARSLGGARAVLVDGGRRASAAALRYVNSGLPAAAGQPRVIARSSWATESCRPRVPSVFGAVDLAFVHHTVSSNAYRPSQSAGMVRSICLFHKYGNGWNDIGYNFVVDRYGQIFEARAGGIDEAIVGAQAGGYNAFSTGVALLGTFASAGPPRKAFDSLARLLAWKLSLHGIPLPGTTTVQVTRDGAPYSRYRAGTWVKLNRISGHRDADTTECPGSAMYRQLPRLRQRARALAGQVSTLTAQLQATAPGAATVGGQLTEAGAPIPGATVEIQSRSTTRGPTTVATATTAGDGTWSAGFGLAANAPLRAVFRGDGEHAAVVSPGVWATVPPQLNLTAATQQTLPGGVIEFSGSVLPVKKSVTIVISQQQLDGSFAEIRSIRVNTAADGSFSRSIGFPDAGRYQVIAHTAADAANALGTSAPIDVTIA